jgi:hypothetical protein
MAIRGGMFVAKYVVASLHWPPRSSMTSGGRVNQQAAIWEVVMKLTRATTTGAMLLALAVSAVPAVAGSSDQDRRDRPQARAARVQPSNGGNSARPETNNDRASGRQTRASSASDTRQAVARPRVVPRENSPARSNDRQYASRQNDSRTYDVAVPRTAPRADSNTRSNDRQYANRQPDTRQNASRQSDTRQYNTRQYDSRQYNTRSYNSRAYSYGGYGNYGGYGYRPYLSRSYVRFGLGISIFAGRSYGFRFDYGWAPPYAYRFPMRSGIGYGGMSFLIDPDVAAVYVDGQFIGIARDFDGQPVPLAAGLHEIELQAEGCEPVMFDITVRPGQVIPYRGSLMPIR